MAWLIVVLAIVAGLGLFLVWVSRQAPTRPRDDNLLGPLFGIPGDVLDTDRALRRSYGENPPDDDDKIVV